MNVSIRTRLIVLVLAAVLPVLLLASWFIWEGVQADYGKARTAATSAARLSATRVDDYVNNLKSLLLAIGPSASSDPADAEKNDALFRTIKTALPDYTSAILAFDLKGNNIGASQWVFDRNKLFTGDRNYFKAALEGRSQLFQGGARRKSHGERSDPFPVRRLVDCHHRKPTAGRRRRRTGRH
jgi:hypothetical protein